MPPADNNTPAPVPPAPKPEKVGFFARLFGKKPKSATSVVPPHGSQTPPPQLGNDSLDASVIAGAPTTEPVAPSAVPGADVTPPAGTVPPATPGATPDAPVGTEPPKTV
jgi:hypothetical protein